MNRREMILLRDISWVSLAKVFGDWPVPALRHGVAAHGLRKRTDRRLARCWFSGPARRYTGGL
jgi:hypothetical protein